MKIHYLDIEAVINIHSVLISESGGAHGVRDRGAIHSAVALPEQSVFSKELYPTLFLKAAVYARSIMFNHPFIDGNKRTGITVAVIFLELNGLMFTAPKGGVEKLALTIIEQKLDIESIAELLRVNTRN